MHFQKVKTGPLCALCRLAVLDDDAGQLFSFQRARHFGRHVFLLAIRLDHEALCAFGNQR